MLFTIDINGQQVSAKRGETILTVLNRNGIKVPTLCNMSGFTPTGACRMCIVEVENMPNLVPACSHPVEEWMRISTHSPRVLKARKSLVELLLANHPDDCLYCERNNNCELQTLALELNIRERKYKGHLRPVQIDRFCPSIERNPAKCILCGRCVRVCDETIGASALDIIGRGHQSMIGTTYNKGLNAKTCVKCGQCIMVCPTGAITEKTNFYKVIDILHDTDIYPVIQFSPTVPASIAEAFGIRSGKDVLNILRAGLRRIGFRLIIDTGFAADIAILEEAAELKERLNGKGKLPMFTSCCPAWVKYVRDVRPEFIPNLATVRSPQQIMGKIIKEYITSSLGYPPEKIYTVSVMPCVAKKYESENDRLNAETTLVDTVITTRELIKMIRQMGIDLSGMEPDPADATYGMISSSGRLFGIAGGAAEGIIRTFYNLMTGQDISPYRIMDLRGLKGKKEARIKIGKNIYNVVSVSGLAQAKALLDEIANGRDDIHLVEVMACPFGCINGGGQSIGTDEKNLKSRSKYHYDIDEDEMIKMAHKNQLVQDIYNKFLGKPYSERSRKILHVDHNAEIKE